MKFIQQNRTLSIAIAASVFAHVLLLAVRFAAPESFRPKPTDTGMEVILVNAKHQRAPLKAEALAQANLDGGGNADAGRSKSPLPDLRRNETGDSVKVARRKIVEMEQRQQKLLTQMKNKRFAVNSAPDINKPNDVLPQPDAADATESAKAIARKEAEIAKNIEEYNKRPKKTQITPSTREVGYAAYYKMLQERIEKMGTLNFPQQDGKKLYGDMVIYIPIYQDGTIYERDGGPRIERSSGTPALDKAALRIVRRAAPFGRFPDKMRSTDKEDVWEIITRFKFTREEALEADLRGAN